MYTIVDLIEAHLHYYETSGTRVDYQWYFIKELNMFLVPTKSRVLKFSPYKILMVILVLQNIVVCNNSPYFENFTKMNTISPPK